MPNGNITVHCIPVDDAAGAAGECVGAGKGKGRGRGKGGKAVDLATELNNPRLQRWVGVQYHPETELESHYGEMRMGRCFDMVVYVDSTTALKPLPAVKPPANKRLSKEHTRMLRSPSEGIEAHPLPDNVLEWHFLLRPTEPPYKGGEYHGVLEFPPE